MRVTLSFLYYACIAMNSCCGPPCIAVTITWRLKTMARTARDGIQQATEAMQQWGMPAEEVTRMTAATTVRVTQLTSEAQTVAIAVLNLLE